VAIASQWRRAGVTRWDLGDLPETVVVAQQPRDLVLYPCLVDNAASVDLRLEPPGAAAVALHRAGVRRLLIKVLPQQAALVRDRTLADRDLVLAYHGIGASAALVDDVLCQRREFRARPPIHPRPRLRRPSSTGVRIWWWRDELRALLHAVLPAYRSLKRALDAAAEHEAHAAVRDDLATQLKELVGTRMLTTTPREWRPHLKRYLAAAELRWQKRGQRAELTHAAQVREAAERLAHWRATRPDGWPGRARWSTIVGSSRSCACRCSRSRSERALGVGETRRAGVAQGARGA
jgi:ATP-dependent helicase HrpA